MAGNFDRAGLGRSESEGSGGYSAKNSEGYVGKYQFGDTRLADYMKSTGASFTKEEFRGNPVLQERVQAWHEQDILDYAVDNGLDRYFGGRIGGVPITPASLIGMSHIGGKAGMRQFVESGGEYNPSDSNGTSLSDYGMKFAGDTGMVEEEFRGNPVLQERVQAWHEQDILDYAVDNGLDRYFGGRIGGVPITPASLIGMSHIGGKAGMRQFVESGGEYNPSDSNGTSLSDYGMKFAGDTGMVEESIRPRSRPMVPELDDAGIASLIDRVRGGMGSAPVQAPMLRPRARPVVSGGSAEMVAPDVRATRTAIERLGDIG